MMNPNCKWKRDNDLNIKEKKNIEKKIQKKFLFTCILESKIHGVYIRKKLRPSWNRKGNLGQTNKIQ